VEFLGSNEEEMGVEAYIEEGTLSPSLRVALTEDRFVIFFYKKGLSPSPLATGVHF